MLLGLIILLMLILSAFFSGIEIAFLTSNKLKIEVDKNKGLFTGRILSRFGKTPSKFIGTMLLGNNIAMVIYGIAMASILAPFLERVLPDFLNSEFLNLLFQTILSTILILVVAEFLPKALFRINPNAVLNFFTVPIYVFYYFLFPLVMLFTGLAEILIRLLFKIRISRMDYSFSIVDLEAYIREFSPENEAEGDGVQEIQMFQNAIEFRNAKLRECMVPRTEIIAIEEMQPVEELRDLFIASGYSKILIYRDTIDNIIGYTHVLDIFSHPPDITSVLKPVSIYPESMLANLLLNRFIQERRSIAVVVDEFGGTSGIVTIEDLMEEIFGEIADEFDSEELTDKRLNDDEFLLSGRLEIDYINEKYGLEIPESEDYETLAGFILSHSGSIPVQDQEIIIGIFVFRIAQVSETRIELVHLKLMA